MIEITNGKFLNGSVEDESNQFPKGTLDQLMKGALVKDRQVLNYPAHFPALQLKIYFQIFTVSCLRCK